MPAQATSRREGAGLGRSAGWFMRNGVVGTFCALDPARLPSSGGLPSIHVAMFGIAEKAS